MEKKEIFHTMQEKAQGIFTSRADGVRASRRSLCAGNTRSS